MRVRYARTLSFSRYSTLYPLSFLAEGETLGSNGRELVTAYVAGYEVWAELLRRAYELQREEIPGFSELAGRLLDNLLATIVA